MNGLELARAFYEAERPFLEKKIPDILSHAAIGLVGEGSECLGFDDAISQDHDYGPCFCFWIEDALLQRERKRIEDAFDELPKEWNGLPSRLTRERRIGRVGPLSIEAFYAGFLGKSRAPETVEEWLAIPEYHLSNATNGEVFEDNSGVFSSIRDTLLKYYPEQVSLTKLAARCMQMAQSGQYNFPRALERGQSTSALLALSRFIEAAISFVHIINKRYMPFYKHAPQSLSTLPILGARMTQCLQELTGNAICSGGEEGKKAEESIERFAEDCAQYLRDNALSQAPGNWL
ncbi:MAG: DUF4037 domain-containing protein, partial [Desulfovibrio sp.]|nr:DUF4037 domain-containing protein [Desulfovibrio sp.]